MSSGTGHVRIQRKRVVGYCSKALRRDDLKGSADPQKRLVVTLLEACRFGAHALTQSGGPNDPQLRRCYHLIPSTNQPTNHMKNRHGQQLASYPRRLTRTASRWQRLHGTASHRQITHVLHPTSLPYRGSVHLAAPVT
jgi:hypothetical protein